MLKVNPMAQVLTASEIARLEALSTPPICDALGKLNIEVGGCLAAAIKSVSKNRKLLGVACTVLAPAGNSFPLHYAAYNTGSGYVLTVDTGSFE